MMNMLDYKKMYGILFNQTTAVIEALKKAQQNTEEIYLNSEDTPVHLLVNSEKHRDK